MSTTNDKIIIPTTQTRDPREVRMQYETRGDKDRLWLLTADNSPAPDQYIPPTVGRKLWMWLDSAGSRPLSFAAVVVMDGQPMDATIVFVEKRRGDYDYVTVSFTDHKGNTRAAGGVPLRQAGQRTPDARVWLEWMPYQVGQAKAPHGRAEWAKAYGDGTAATGPAPLPELSPDKQDGKGLLSFGTALDLLKHGAKVARLGWNGKGMWLSLSGPLTGREIAFENFWSKNNSEYARANGGSAVVLPSISMKTADGSILMGWLASQTDMLADDWVVVE